MIPRPDRRLAVSQSMLDNISMADDLDMACESGAHAVALYAPLVRATGTEETVRLLRERDLGVTSIHLGLKILELDEATARTALCDGLELAAGTGAPVATASPGSNNGYTAAEADETYARRLAGAAPLATELGVVMGIEPLHPFLHAACHIHTIRHAASIASRVDNCGIIFDTAHLYWDGNLAEDIGAHAEMLCLVQVANLDKAALEQGRWVRTQLHAGVAPVTEIVRMIDAAGYCGAYESELLLGLTHRECIEAARAARLWFEQIWHDRK